jgi:hypothetical protein
MVCLLRKERWGVKGEVPTALHPCAFILKNQKKKKKKNVTTILLHAKVGRLFLPRTVDLSDPLLSPWTEGVQCMVQHVHQQAQQAQA